MLKGYIQPVEVAAGLGYDLSDAQLLAEVSLAIEFCETGIDAYCDCEFQWEENQSKLYDGAGNNIVSLGAYLRTLREVWLLDSTGARYEELLDVVAQPTPLKSNTAYRWIQRRQPLTGGGDSFYDSVVQATYTFPLGLANVEVVGDWGWKPEEMPVPIKQAMLYMVKHFFDLRLYNDLVQVDSGLGRSIVFKTPKQDVDQPVHYVPEVSRNILNKWKNSTWMSP